MMKMTVLAIALVGVLALPVTGLAHEGHAHKYMGTVTALQDNRLEIKTPEGKTVMVTLNAKTTYARGKQKVAASEVKVGERVVVEVPSEKAMIASAVTMAAPTPAAVRR